MTQRTASQASRNRIEAAALASRKPRKVIHRTDAEGGQALLELRRPMREVPLPEPVQVPALVNGRPPEGWEELLYVRAMQRERRAELELFRGLIG